MAIDFEAFAVPIRAMDRELAYRLLKDEPTYQPTAFVAATIWFLSAFNLLARGVSDDKFRRMVALPLAIPQSQHGVGTSGTPIFFSPHQPEALARADRQRGASSLTLRLNIGKPPAN